MKSTLLTIESDSASADNLAGQLVVRNPADSALATSFNLQVRPMLDLIDQLRNFGVMEEGIQLPTIVVVGDQSSGKSSVLESLAGISLPRGQGIATRVPLILRLQNCKSDSEAYISIQYGDVKKEIPCEELIEEAINAATDVLAGTGKDIRDAPISLDIHKPDAPDLTMIDLPGITRVPVHGQPDDIYEQISVMIQKFISPTETIILNVLSATVDFPTCESIRMSQQADKEGRRTLAVVTKVDRAPEGLYEKVTTDAVHIGLGYVCVRNRTDDDDSHEQARVREQNLFDNHPVLSRLSKDMVGIPMLAKRLTHIQVSIIRGSLPKIIKQIHDALYRRRQEYESLPRGMKDVAEAGLVFAQMQNSRTKILAELVREGHFESFPDANEMHYTARMHEKFQTFADDLQKSGSGLMATERTKEISHLLSEYKGVGLPDFLPHPVLHLLVGRQVDNITACCKQLVYDTHAYAADVVQTVDKTCSEGYPQMGSYFKRSALLILEQTKKRSLDFVERMLKKEKSIVFTTNHYYMDTLSRMYSALETANTSGCYNGEVEIDNGEILKMEEDCENREYCGAWRMKASLAAYWKVVQKRLADEIPLEIRYALEKAIVQDIHDEMMARIWSGESIKMQELMQEDSHLAQKRARLERSIDTLEKSAEAVSGFMA